MLTVLTATASVPAVAASADPIRLPLTIVRNSLLTNIEVGGHEIKVGVDTGGGILGLTQEALTQAGAVELAGDPQIWTDGNGGSHKARRFRVPQIRVGGQLFTNVEAIEAEPSPNGSGVASALGREFLRQFIAIIDYPARIMTLLPPETADADAEAMGCKGTRVPFERTSARGLVITAVKLDGATMRLVWDTGASYSMLPAGVVTAYQLPVTPPVGQKPPFYNTKRLVMGGADLGPLDFAVLPLELPSDFEGMLGYNLFANHVVCMNYGRSELRVR